MENFSYYKKFLNDLDFNDTSWSQIDKFMDYYKNLSLADRIKFNRSTNDEKRFELLDSYLSRYNKELKNDVQANYISMAEQFFYYISLDNLDYDYRESIIRIIDFIDISIKHNINLIKIWENLKLKMPEVTVETVNRLITSKYN